MVAIYKLKHALVYLCANKLLFILSGKSKPNSKAYRHSIGKRAERCSDVVMQVTVRQKE